jgi:GNAT superfamily N-acetyltransferase
MEFNIQKAKPVDAAALIELNREFNKLKMPLAIVKKRLSRTGKESVFLARAGRTAVGYICVQYSCSICYPRPWVEVTEMYVRSRYRRKGIATALLNAAEKKAHRLGAGLVLVLTGECNTRGQRLYTSAGYRGTKKFVYEKVPGEKPAQTTEVRRT